MPLHLVPHQMIECSHIFPPNITCTEMPSQDTLPDPVEVPLDRLIEADLPSADPIEFETLVTQQKNDIVARLREALKGKKVLSLDVFDTILLRDNTPEAERYLELSQHLDRAIVKAFPDLSSPGVRALLEARIEGMQLTYRTGERKQDCNEGSIYDVVHSVALAITADPVRHKEVAKWLLDEEIAYETRVLSLNPAIAEIVAEFAKKGRVILISDMYLHADEIRRLFEAIEPKFLKHISALISSADEIVSKHRGPIFDLVSRRLKFKPDDVLHIGDSLSSDVHSARKAGWSAQHFPVPSSCMSEREARLVKCIADLRNMGMQSTQWAKI